MSTYTLAQVAAADELANANAHLMDVLAHEPITYGAAYDLWRDEYDQAYTAHETAESVYRERFPGQAPTAFDVLNASPTVLQRASVPGVWTTGDGRFLAAPFAKRNRRAGRWTVEYWAAGILEDTPRPTVKLVAADREHVQQVIDQITWAMTDGARTSDVAVR
ncbi:hypothetical protein [Nocardia abscessus]|uniref:hypothetical protein n=1 Tax=Nocardia abscessus TaxID=120957 RepID=UPI002457FC73|nr:hypothetical protein [Nocardia abscessus]